MKLFLFFYLCISTIVHLPLIYCMQSSKTAFSYNQTNTSTLSTEHIAKTVYRHGQAVCSLKPDNSDVLKALEIFCKEYQITSLLKPNTSLEWFTLATDICHWLLLNKEKLPGLLKQPDELIATFKSCKPILIRNQAASVEPATLTNPQELTSAYAAATSPIAHSAQAIYLPLAADLAHFLPAQFNPTEREQAAASIECEDYFSCLVFRDLLYRSHHYHEQDALRTIDPPKNAINDDTQQNISKDTHQNISDELHKVLNYYGNSGHGKINVTGILETALIWRLNYIAEALFDFIKSYPSSDQTEFAKTMPFHYFELAGSFEKLIPTLFEWLFIKVRSLGTINEQAIIEIERCIRSYLYALPSILKKDPEFEKRFSGEEHNAHLFRELLKKQLIARFPLADYRVSPIADYKLISDQFRGFHYCNSTLSAIVQNDDKVMILTDSYDEFSLTQLGLEKKWESMDKPRLLAGLGKACTVGETTVICYKSKTLKDGSCFLQGYLAKKNARFLDDFDMEWPRTITHFCPLDATQFIVADSMGIHLANRSNRIINTLPCSLLVNERSENIQLKDVFFQKNSVLALYANGSIRIWSANSLNTELYVIDLSICENIHCTMLTDSLIAIAFAQNSIGIWHKEHGLVNIFSLPGFDTHACCFVSVNEDIIAIGCNNGTVYLYSIMQKKIIGKKVQAAGCSYDRTAYEIRALFMHDGTLRIVGEGFNREKVCHLSFFDWFIPEYASCDKLIKKLRTLSSRTYTYHEMLNKEQRAELARISSAATCQWLHSHSLADMGIKGQVIRSYPFISDCRLLEVTINENNSKPTNKIIGHQLNSLICDKIANRSAHAQADADFKLAYFHDHYFAFCGPGEIHVVTLNMPSSTLHLTKFPWLSFVSNLCAISKDILLIVDEKGMHLVNLDGTSAGTLEGHKKITLNASGAATAAASLAPMSAHETDIPVQRVVADKNVIMGSFADGTVKIWDRADATILKCIRPPKNLTIKPGTNSVCAIAALNNHQVVIAYPHCQLILYDLKKNETVNHFIPLGAAQAMCFTQLNEHIIAIGVDDGSVHCYDLVSKNIVQTIPAKHGTKVITLEGENGQLQISYSDGTIEEWFFPQFTK